MQHISKNCWDYTRADRLSGLEVPRYIIPDPSGMDNSALFPEVEVAAGLSSIRVEKETIDLRRINRRGRSCRDEMTR